MALSKLSLVKGGFKIDFVGLTNFRTLFLGSERAHLLGQAASPSWLGWLVFLGGTALLLIAFVRTARSRQVKPLGLIGRAVGGLLLVLLLWLVATTVLGSGGRPGTLMVTLVYAFSGTFLTYLLGLGLAVLTTMRLRGQRLFRIVFLVPLMITPVGVAYMFRMLTDTQRGPITPLWRAAGLSDFTLLGDPWGARIAVIISDVWQWTPFMFIVLLAALEGRDLETEEAATVDGASKWRIFLHITMPALIPVSATVILIRMIEAFQSHRPAKCADERWPGHCHRVAHPAVFHLMACVRPGLVGRGRIHVAGGRDDGRHRLRDSGHPANPCDGLRAGACDEEPTPQALCARPVAASEGSGLRLPHRLDRHRPCSPSTGSPSRRSSYPSRWVLGRSTFPGSTSRRRSTTGATSSSTTGAIRSGRSSTPSSWRCAARRWRWYWGPQGPTRWCASITRPRIGVIAIWVVVILGIFVAIALGVPLTLALAVGVAVLLLLLQTIGKRFERTLANSDVSFWLISQRMMPPVAVVVRLLRAVPDPRDVGHSARADRDVYRRQLGHRGVADA